MASAPKKTSKESASSSTKATKKVINKATAIDKNKSASKPFPLEGMKGPILKKRRFAPDFGFEEDFNIIRKNMIALCEAANNSPEDEDVFFDTFRRIIEQARENYLPAQDYLGYVFKKGLGDLIPANYDTAMSWQFVSGSNGNPYTISKLKIFFARSYDGITELEDFESICQKNSLYDNNYEFVLGKLFCDAMCDEIGIDISALADKKPVFLPETLSLSQKFEEKRIVSLSKVIDYLRK